MPSTTTTHVGKKDQKEIKLPYTSVPLTDDDVISLKEIIYPEYEQETAKASALTKGNILSDDEFKNGSEQAQRLVADARAQGHPIFIMPEDKILHPQLQTMVDGIEQGKPYHTFITKKYGETWPLALRLVFGSKATNLKITMEQFDSIMTLSYWLSSGLKIENIPLFQSKDVLTQVGKLLNEALFQPEQTAQKNEFITKIQDPKIPEGERHVQVIYLNADYYRIYLLVLLRIFIGGEIPESHMTEVLHYDAKVNTPVAGPFSKEKTIKFMFKSGLRTIAENLQMVYAYNRVFFIDNPRGKGKLAVYLLPSQTMFNRWYTTLNPGRKQEVALRAGINFSIATMEEDCNHGRRTVGLTAPGIPSSFINHCIPVTPFTQRTMHEQHHIDWDAMIPQSMIDETIHAKNGLRQFYPDRSKCTTSILRFLDREVHPKFSPEERFFYLVTFPFRIIKQQLDSKLHFCSVLTLIDIILVPSAWPDADFTMMIRLIDAMLPCTGFKPTLMELNTRIRGFAAQVNHNRLFMAALLLCHYYLRDTELCQHLLTAIKQQHPERPLIALRKQNHGDFYFVLVHRGFRDYTFEELAKMDSASRVNLVSESRMSKVEFKHETGSGNATALLIPKTLFSEAKTAVLPKDIEYAEKNIIDDDNLFNGSRGLSKEEKDARAEWDRVPAYLQLGEKEEESFHAKNKYLQYGQETTSPGDELLDLMFFKPQEVSFEDPETNFINGRHLCNGTNGFPQDYEKALEQFKIAANKNHARAQFQFGLMLANGLGCAKDERGASEWFEKAKANGYTLNRPDIRQVTSKDPPYKARGIDGGYEIRKLLLRI